MPNPNIIAYMMLLVWPFVAWQLYHRLDPARALIWTLLAGYLILPPLTSFDFPVVPDFDKDTIPALVAVALSIFVLRDRIGLLPSGWLGRLLVGLFVLSPIVTVLSNPDPLPYVEGVIPGMRAYDSIAAVANHVIYALPPVSGPSVSGHARGGARAVAGLGGGGLGLFTADAD